jgi:uncharacterized membrane protein YbaN (DUF454 family)
MKEFLQLLADDHHARISCLSIAFLLTLNVVGCWLPSIPGTPFDVFAVIFSVKSD